MKTYGFEFTVLPLLGFPYFYLFQNFSLPSALANNAALTAACAGGAYYVSYRIAKGIAKGKGAIDRLAPAWPAFISLWLAYMAVLQLIACVTHLSYYRTGDFSKDLFDKHL